MIHLKNSCSKKQDSSCRTMQTFTHIEKLDTMIHLKNICSIKQDSSCRTMPNLDCIEEKKSGYLHSLFREKSSKRKQIPTIYIKKEVDLKIKTTNTHFGKNSKKLIKIVNESRLNA